jgi:tRNA splicing ligase
MSVHSNVPKIAKLITSEIKTIEDKKTKWASFKRENAQKFKELLHLEHTDMENPGELLGFDIDEERQLILLNYTGQAHNVLHEVDRGWSQPLRDMRGMIYDFSVEEPVLVSRGFEKFFNFSELPENTYEALTDKFGTSSFLAREKADGHMIEYFVHNGELCSSTRGKFGTVSAEIANDMLSLSDFQQVEKTVGKKLMTVVVELIHPYTKVFVDYDNAETLYLLNAYDSDGNSLDVAELEYICESMPHLFICPESREMTLNEIVDEVSSRSVSNHEGWVMNFNGQLVKFKYINYIGEMVKSKLSYKYIMNCMIKGRLDKMMWHTRWLML